MPHRRCILLAIVRRPEDMKRATHGSVLSAYPMTRSGVRAFVRDARAELGGAARLRGARFVELVRACDTWMSNDRGYLTVLGTCSPRSKASRGLRCTFGTLLRGLTRE